MIVQKGIAVAHKKGAIEISLKTLIGFILVILIFFVTAEIFFRLWAIFLNEPNQATINSFKNLIYEINTLKEGEEKVVPFYIQKGLYLKTECHTSIHEPYVPNDLCICTKNCKKRLVRERIALNKDIIIKGGEISYEKKEVKNLRIKNNEQVVIEIAK